jgi:hypothetical protein
MCRFHLEGGRYELYADHRDAIPVPAIAAEGLHKLLRLQDTFYGTISRAEAARALRSGQPMLEREDFHWQIHPPGEAGKAANPRPACAAFLRRERF